MAFLMSHVRLGCLRRTFTVCRDLKSCSHGGHAYVGWMLLLEDRLIHKHRGELEPGSINKDPQRLPYACSNCQKSRQYARGVGSLQSCDCRIGRRLESRAIINRWIQPPASATARKREGWFWFIGLASMIPALLTRSCYPYGPRLERRCLSNRVKSSLMGVGLESVMARMCSPPRPILLS